MTGSPSDRITRGKTGASQVTGPSSSYVPWCTRRLRLLPHFGPDPSSPLLLFEKISGEIVIAFTQFRTLGIRDDIAFEGSSRRLRVNPRPTRSRAYASPIPLPRPSPSSLPALAGSPLAGQVSHLRDSERNFMESSLFLQSQSISSAWSHLFHLRPLALSLLKNE